MALPSSVSLETDGGIRLSAICWSRLFSPEGATGGQGGGVTLSSLTFPSIPPLSPWLLHTNTWLDVRTVPPLAVQSLLQGIRSFGKSENTVTSRRNTAADLFPFLLFYLLLNHRCRPLSDSEVKLGDGAAQGADSEGE